MAVDRKHEIIEIDKMGDLADSYFIKRGIIYSRDCDNNRLNVWIEGTLFENLEIFYHCENETESTPDKAFDLFEVGRKVLVLHKIIYQVDDGKKTNKIEKIERTVVGLKYNSPEGINNIQPCVVKRFFVRVKKIVDDSPVYFYYWFCIDEEKNITTIKINDNEDKTEAEVLYDLGFFSELEKILYLGDPLLNPLTQSATKSFMMTNDKGFRERWVATPCFLFKDQCNILEVPWVAPPPCDITEMPCPPNRFYCDIEKRILVWYGAYEVFIGATIVKFNTDTSYTQKCVAASGTSIGAPSYKTITGTENDIPINMIADVKSVSNTEISFYLSHMYAFDRPGCVTIDWVNYEWGPVISAVGVEETEHWYWSAEGFEQRTCAVFDQNILDDSVEYEIENFSDDLCTCGGFTRPECEACSEIKQNTGVYELDPIGYLGYNSLYEIKLFDKNFLADTKYHNFYIGEQKSYRANYCFWLEGSEVCIGHGTYGYSRAERFIWENLTQKVSNGLSASWLSNNIAYFFKEIERNKCAADASQVGKIYKSPSLYIPWGGPIQDDFDNCHWVCNPCCLCAEDCPDGLGKCFRREMPGEGWLDVEQNYIEHSGGSYTWHKKSDISTYEEPLVRKLKLDDIEFDATEIYKTYYLDDRATCHEQGLLIAGKGVRDSKIFWEVYHDGINITEKLFEALNCGQSELDEIGLI